jgi:hypothetical protein
VPSPSDRYVRFAACWSFESFGLAEVQAVETVILLAACLAVTHNKWMMRLVVLIDVVGCDQEDPIVVGANRVERYRRLESPLEAEQRVGKRCDLRCASPCFMSLLDDQAPGPSWA